jgi:hypothetical protein
LVLALRGRFGSAVSSTCIRRFWFPSRLSSLCFFPFLMLHLRLGPPPPPPPRIYVLLRGVSGVPGLALRLTNSFGLCFDRRIFRQLASNGCPLLPADGRPVSLCLGESPIPHLPGSAVQGTLAGRRLSCTSHWETYYRVFIPGTSPAFQWCDPRALDSKGARNCFLTPQQRPPFTQRSTYISCRRPPVVILRGGGLCRRFP